MPKKCGGSRVWRSGHSNILGLDCFQEGKMVDLVESNEDLWSEWEMVEIFVMVGIWCVQEDPSLRPTMRTIQLLE